MTNNNNIIYAGRAICFGTVHEELKDEYGFYFRCTMKPYYKIMFLSGEVFNEKTKETTIVDNIPHKILAKYLLIEEIVNDEVVQSKEILVGTKWTHVKHAVECLKNNLCLFEEIESIFETNIDRFGNPDPIPNPKYFQSQVKNGLCKYAYKIHAIDKYRLFFHNAVKNFTGENDSNYFISEFSLEDAEIKAENE